MNVFMPGADVNVENIMGNSAVMFAAMNGKLEVIQVMKTKTDQENVKLNIFTFIAEAFLIT